MTIRLAHVSSWGGARDVIKDEQRTEYGIVVIDGAGKGHEYPQGTVYPRSADISQAIAKHASLVSVKVMQRQVTVRVGAWESVPLPADEPTP